MALSTDQVVYIRRQVGSSPPDADLQAIFDRTGDVDVLVLEILETRYADMLANPTSFSVSGEYSQSTGENLKALQKQIAVWRAYMASIGLDPGPVIGAVRITTPDDTPWR